MVAGGNLGSVLPSLNFLALVLLRDDILLDTFLDPLTILTFHSPLVSLNSAIGALLRPIPFLAHRVPILHSSQHMLRLCDQVFVVLDERRCASCVQSLLIMAN